MRNEDSLKKLLKMI